LAIHHTSALIIARSGELRDSLEALVGTMPQIAVVDTADQIPENGEGTSHSCPELVLLVGDSFGSEIWLKVRRVKARYPRARCVVLANNVQQQQEAMAAGAHAVLLAGTPPGQLVATIVRFLPRREKPEEAADVVVSAGKRPAETRRKTWEPCRTRRCVTLQAAGRGDLGIGRSASRTLPPSRRVHASRENAAAATRR
jgi:DNA-binding NarL/FixJ family response regulator